jgi:vacuole morphology and inheritance protein 14
VRIDYAAIIEILIQQLDNQRELFPSKLTLHHTYLVCTDDEIQQSTALRWLAEFLTFVPDVMVPFTPRLIPAILPNLAHHVPMIQSAALRTNKLLSNVIQNLPGPVEGLSRQNTAEKSSASASSPTPISQPSRQITVQPPSRDASSPESMGDNQPSSSSDKTTMMQRPRSGTMQTTVTESSSRPHSRMSSNSAAGAPPPPPAPAPAPPSPVQEEADQFNYQATVNELTIQFLSEHEETRVAALKWLIMLHQKAPKKVCLSPSGGSTN